MLLKYFLNIVQINICTFFITDDPITIHALKCLVNHFTNILQITTRTLFITDDPIRIHALKCLLNHFTKIVQINTRILCITDDAITFQARINRLKISLLNSECILKTLRAYCTFATIVWSRTYSSVVI